jgi:formylglycine-generating enzyme
MRRAIACSIALSVSGCPKGTPPAPADAGVEVLDAGLDAGVEGLPDAAVVDAKKSATCPRDMVEIDGELCIDRYEDVLVDNVTGAPLSPHYPPEPDVAGRMHDKWEAERLTVGSETARAMALPPLPDIERREFKPRAVSKKGVLPQGYVSGKVAEAACVRAGKRLCTLEEWRHACRGEKQTKFPYGDEYVAGMCNVFRSEHPAQILHDNASLGHSDPRLGLAQGSDGPLLRATGATPTCASVWGKDAVYDMVGNRDEWIDDPEGTFVGGFFSRASRDGCDAMVTFHPFDYWDYSLGVRCCRTPR